MSDQMHEGKTFAELFAAVEKVEAQIAAAKPITGGEWFRFLHPDEPEEDTGDEIAEEL